ncbi:hypothetical protein TI05_16505 [Achromatium sp. WMS3]|nr:hypothetical protein TI05_16505 [Achromatium sp. WMS3]
MIAGPEFEDPMESEGKLGRTKITWGAVGFFVGTIIGLITWGIIGGFAGLIVGMLIGMTLATDTGVIVGIIAGVIGGMCIMQIEGIYVPQMALLLPLLLVGIFDYIIVFYFIKKTKLFSSQDLWWWQGLYITLGLSGYIWLFPIQLQKIMLPLSWAIGIFLVIVIVWGIRLHKYYQQLQDNKLRQFHDTF